MSEVKAIRSYISDRLGVWDERGSQACLCSNSVLVIIHLKLFRSSVRQISAEAVEINKHLDCLSLIRGNEK